MFVQSTEPIEQTLDRMGLVLFLVGVGGIVAAALIGLAVGPVGLMPVRRLSAAAEHIARTEELTPIEVTGDDELASLADVVQQDARRACRPPATGSDGWSPTPDTSCARR